MPKCTNKKLDFGRFGRRVIEVDFDGGDLSSEAGVLLLRRMDQHLGLCASAARALGDERQRGKVRHSLASRLAQRVYGLCQGWSDVCDHNALRADLAMQTAVGRDEALASAPTLSRLETAATPAQAWALQGVLLDQFIASRRTGPAPRELVLDVDGTQLPLHGEQERGFFHGYYDNYCYLPLYVFCGQDLLTRVLRPSDRDPASVVTALLKRLVDALRQAWPKGCLGRALPDRPAKERAAAAPVRTGRAGAGRSVPRLRHQAARVRQLRVRRRQLGQAPARDRAAGARPARDQPALHRHQPGR